MMVATITILKKLPMPAAEYSLNTLISDILQYYLDKRDTSSCSQFYMRLFFNRELTNQKTKIIENLKQRISGHTVKEQHFESLYDTYHCILTLSNKKQYNMSDGECGIALRICMERILHSYKNDYAPLIEHIKTMIKDEAKQTKIRCFISSMIKDLRREHYVH